MRPTTLTWMRIAVASVALALLSIFVATAAWGLWSMSSVPGGGGSAAAATVGSGQAPVAEVSGSAVVVTWPQATLSSGAPVQKYRVARYSTTMVAAAVVSTCAGAVESLGCVEYDVPAGQWTYTVTPLVGDNWVGAASAASNQVTSTGAGSQNMVWFWVTP